MLGYLSRSLPQTSKYFTQYLGCTGAWGKITPMKYRPRIWVQCSSAWGKITPTEAVHFHKALPIIRGMYVTLKELYPPHDVQVPGVK